MILDGKKLSQEMRIEIKQDADTLIKMGVTPCAMLIKVGEDEGSEMYLNMKRKACSDNSIKSEIVRLPESTTESDLISIIERFNRLDTVHGILVQLPLPKHIDVKRVMSIISPKKDVDCFNPINIGKFYSGTPYTEPCTPAGIMALLKRYHIDLEGKNALVVGRSEIVGKPIVHMLLNANCSVQVCHSKTLNYQLYQAVANADIIVCATGKRNVIPGRLLKSRHTIVDVGANRDDNGKPCGDLDVVQDCVWAYTPVPGGVGPMTITMLLKNTIKCAKEMVYAK